MSLCIVDARQQAYRQAGKAGKAGRQAGTQGRVAKRDVRSMVFFSSYVSVTFGHHLIIMISGMTISI
jgi:hypothetical protein